MILSSPEFVRVVKECISERVYEKDKKNFIEDLVKTLDDENELYINQKNTINELEGQVYDLEQRVDELEGCEDQNYSLERDKEKLKEEVKNLSGMLDRYNTLANAVTCFYVHGNKQLISDKHFTALLDHQLEIEKLINEQAKQKEKV